MGRDDVIWSTPTSEAKRIVESGILAESSKKIQQAAKSAEAPKETADWQINSITREDGGLLLSASREGKEAGYAIVTNLGDGIFELNEIRVNDTFKRQGLGTELYRNAAQKVKALGGKLYTSPEMTDAGKALRDSIDKAGGLGNNTRVKGAYRREVLSSFNPPAAKDAERGIVAYHGGKGDVELDPSFAGSTTGNPTSVWGVFFTPSQKEAQRYVDDFHQGKGKITTASWKKLRS